jgi:hypothetical protein
MEISHASGDVVLAGLRAGLLMGWSISRMPLEGRAEAQQGGGQWEYKFVNWRVSKDAVKDAKTEEEAFATVTTVLNKQLDEISTGNWEYSGYAIPAGASNSLPLFNADFRGG